jgi:hypothetical protein
LTASTLQSSKSCTLPPVGAADEAFKLVLPGRRERPISPPRSKNRAGLHATHRPRRDRRQRQAFAAGHRAVRRFDRVPCQDASPHSPASTVTIPYPAELA